MRGEVQERKEERERDRKRRDKRKGEAEIILARCLEGFHFKIKLIKV